MAKKRQRVATKGRRITIIGVGPSSYSFTPWRAQNDPGFVIGINNAHSVYGFKPEMIVVMDDLERDRGRHPSYVASIECATKVGGAELLSTETYPLWEVLQRLGLQTALGQKIMTNSCNYALAWAATREDTKEIVLFGYDWVRLDSTLAEHQAAIMVDVGDPSWIRYYRKPLIRQPTEPGLDGCCFLMGWAHAKNIEVSIPEGCTLLDHDRPGFFYGYTHQPDLA